MGDFYALRFNSDEMEKYTKMKASNQSASVSSLRERREYADHELVTGMVNRDPHLVSAFFHVYGEKINQLVWKLLRSPSEHQDMVNATLVQILQSIKNLKEPHRLPQWVSKVTVNSVRSEIRKRQVRRKYFIDIEHPEQHLPPERAHPEDIDGRIFAILRTMKVDNQIVFALHYVEGYTYREIAELQGRSESTIRRQGKRCKAEFYKKAARDLVLASYIEKIDENESI